MRIGAPETMMPPGIDGHETCRRLKQDPETRESVVIFLSSLEETESKVKGLGLGAVDYITKPFQIEEVTARVDTHLTIHRLKESLARKNLELRNANEHMRMELESAAAYVRSILPPPIDFGDRGIRIDWRFIASSTLGGDSFGYHWLDDEHFAIYLLDVSGHGVGPSMLSVSAHNVLRQRTLPATDFCRPDQVLAALNRAFPMQDNQNKFFTIWYGVYNRNTRELSYATGGHHAAVLFDPARPEPADLGMCNFMIGPFDDAEYESAAASVGPGSRLYVFSDGAFEIRNRDKEMLDMPGLTKLLQEAQAQEDRLQIVLEHTRRWQERDDFRDDYSTLEISFT